MGVVIAEEAIIGNNLTRDSATHILSVTQQLIDYRSIPELTSYTLAF